MVESNRYQWYQIRCIRFIIEIDKRVKKIEFFINEGIKRVFIN